MQKELMQALETLEAIYFFTQSLEGQALKDIASMRAGYGRLDRQGKREVFKAVQGDVTLLRGHYGAKAPNPWFRRLLREARAEADKGYHYIPKYRIDSLMFRQYEQVFPRWPHVKLHDMVVFDARTNKRLNQIFSLEGAVYRDARFCFDRAAEIYNLKGDFRKRSIEDQLNLISYIRASGALIYHFLEAYLNGLAFDCFVLHHDSIPIEEHDMLGEWDSARKQRRFVSFEKKVFKYPTIVAKAERKKLDLSGCQSAHLVVNDGKELRDALTHPSPYVDPATGELKKIMLLTRVNFPLVESIFSAAREYVLTVERGLGKNPTDTVPWLER